jgi:hypothetical protein
MLSPTAPPFRKVRNAARTAKSARPSPPGVALELLSAAYDDADAALFLEFDRPVTVAAFVGGATIVVRDGAFDFVEYQADTGGATIINPVTVRVVLQTVGPYEGEGVGMSVTAGTGIAAVDDGGTWPGTAGVGLPFP